MLLSEVATFLNQKISADFTIRLFEADSRLVGPNDLFIALPGSKTDGHSFLEDVKNRGACGAIVKETYTGPSFGLELIKVPEPLIALQLLARDHLRKNSARLIGVTGSIGKTTTKEFIAQLLETKFKVTKSKKSRNTKITLPLTILNETIGDEDFIVLEMGMSDPGDIGKLVFIAPPEIAVLTPVTYVHSIAFASLQDIVKNKSEIFSSNKTVAGYIPESLEKSVTKYPHLQFETYIADPTLKEFFKLPGEHNLQNLTAAVKVAKRCGMSEEEIKAAIPALSLPEKRLEFQTKQGIFFINDSYNACWLSMKGAFDTLSTCKHKKKLAVLGDMKNLGNWAQESHKNVLDYAIPRVQTMLLIGPEWSPFLAKLEEAKVNFSHFTSKKELAERLKSEVREGDAVLVKGSNAHELWTLLEEFKP